MKIFITKVCSLLVNFYVYKWMKTILLSPTQMKIPFDTYLGMESTAHRILQTGSKGSCKKEDRVLPRVATDYWEKKVTFFFPGMKSANFPLCCENHYHRYFNSCPIQVSTGLEKIYHTKISKFKSKNIFLPTQRSPKFHFEMFTFKS